LREQPTKPSNFMFIETHAHLDFPQFSKDLEAVIQRAIDSGIEKIITVGTNLQSSRKALSIAERIPAVWAAVGIHPLEAHKRAQPFEKDLSGLLEHPKIVAIGEIGLDFHKFDPSLSPAEIEEQKKIQQEVFLSQLELAKEAKLNVIIHQRAAFHETLSLLSPYQGVLRGVFHCFVGTSKEASLLFSQGHLVSFTGIITFPNAQALRQTVLEIPLENMMLETDCPFLAPVPYRGKRSEPSHVRIIADEIAKIKKISLEEVAFHTTRRASEFFSFQNSKRN
jgi:TatD DNase family protein